MEDEEDPPATPAANAKRKSKINPNSTNNTPSPAGPRTPATHTRKVSENKAATTGQKKRPEPTLLGDFLLGRPSPNRPKNVIDLTNIPVLGRRKSLEDVKRGIKLGMSEENMRRVKQPGKVQVRVMQWQRENAKAGDEVIVVEVEEESEEEGVRMRGGKRPGRRKDLERDEVGNEDGGVKLDQGTPMGKGRNNTPGKGTPDEKGKNTPEQKGKLKVPVSTPKKRVISDDHWMKNKKKNSPPRTGAKIPKNFLQKTAANPPVESKIKDWINRTEAPEPGRRMREEDDYEDVEDTPERKPRNRKASRQEPADDGIRIKPSKDRPYDDGIRVTPSKVSSNDDGIRVTASKASSYDDGIRIRPSRSPSVDDGIRVNKTSKKKLDDDGIRVTASRTPSYDDGIRITPSKISSDGGISLKPQDDDGIRVRPLGETPSKDTRTKPIRRDGTRKASKSEANSDTPTQKSQKHLKTPADFETRSRNSSHAATSHRDLDDNVSHITPSPSEGHSKRKKRKSDSSQKSLEDIPFGNSAFSVLDLPLGAEANTMKRPAPPKRNPSFAAVPKVLKRVYTEGLKVVHNTVEPPRAGPNQPPSIESWLKGTSDPFVDQPASTPTPEASLEVPKTSESRRKSYKEDDETEMQLTADHNAKASGGRKQKKRKSLEVEEPQEEVTPKAAKHRNTLPSMDSSPLVSPPGLKRTPATRASASKTTPRKLPFKAAIFDAFKGESGMKGKKDDAPSPFDFIGLRDRDINIVPHEPRRGQRDDEPLIKDVPTTRPRVPSQSKPAQVDEAKPLPLFPRRQAPTTGHHRLSTIASVETFTTSSGASITETSLTGSSLTETSLEASSVTGSDLSHTTVTQNTILTGTTSSKLSRRSKNSNSGLKRTLTKHSDLVSVLSLPDAVQRGKPGSIRSVRSLKTIARLETATIEDLMKELEHDETKYMRELNTLVDGVIPVLLTCVLSKSKSAIAAGLFNPQAGKGSESASSFTKPIVDMGVALERLKAQHKRIPLTDPDAFLTWANNSHAAYNNYLTSWRAGFQDVVINLAPASTTSGAESTDLEELGRDANGDIVQENGERVDVAFLMKRPVLRIKKLFKVAKGLDKIKHTQQSKEICEKYAELEERRHRRVQEENGRLQNIRACNMDTTRARDIRTLFHANSVEIDPSYQVGASDMFSFEMPHSSGQQIACKVEMILRDKASDNTDGDVLICEFDGKHTFLLFPPVSKSLISARKGESEHQLVVMVRGFIDDDEWSELFTIDAEERETAQEWLQWLGTSPIPGPVLRKSMKLDPELASVVEDPKADTKSIVGALRKAPSTHLPIGERPRPQAAVKVTTRREKVLVESKPPTNFARERYRDKEVVAASKERTNSLDSNKSRPSAPQRHQIITDILDDLGGEEIIEAVSELCVMDVAVLNDAIVKAGKKPAHRLRDLVKDVRDKKTFSDDFWLMVGGLDPYPGEEVKEISPPTTPRPKSVKDEPVVEERKSRPSTPKKEKESTPLRESMRPQADELKKQQKPTTPTREDGAPPPPAHRVPTTPVLKNAPVLETPTPRVKRRTSSPLKHEYQPSEFASSSSSSAEEGSSSESDSDSDFSGSYTDSWDDHSTELEEVVKALPAPLPSPKKASPPGSIYSHPNTSLAPSNSASQGPYRSVPTSRSEMETKKMVAFISTWSNKHGKWEDLWEDPCSIVVGPGVIFAFEMTHKHSSPSRPTTASSTSSNSNGNETEYTPPLIQQVLTPVISLRQSNAIDIEITSPATSASTLKNRTSPQGHVRYRCFNAQDCKVLYASIHEARLNNPIYRKLEMERTINAYGNHAYEDAVKSNRRRSWLGRKRSYRGSSRANSDIISDKSGQTSSSAFSALKRLSQGGIFTLNKSGGGDQSQYSSDRSSSANTPPMSPSLAGTSNYSGSPIRDLGNENLVVRLYCQETGGKDWHQFGYTKLTITTPPPGMRQASSLNHGTEKRITVTKELKSSPRSTPGEGGLSNGKEEVVVLDVVLGKNCFSKMGTTGVVLNVWEEPKGDDGTVGKVGREGGVSGRTRKWLLHAGSGGEREWIFGLVAGGSGGGMYGR